MDPRWHIAFSNMTISEYAGMTYREYYASPANTLEAQLKAKELAEQWFGVGRFIAPHIDAPGSVLTSILGMKLVFSDEDEVPAMDVTQPPINDVTEANKLTIADPRTDALMAKRVAAWRYYASRGYARTLNVAYGSIVTAAAEVSGSSVLTGLLESPDAAERVLDTVLDAHFAAEAAAREICGKPVESGYIGDDFAGLLSPAQFRAFAIPRYQEVYAGKTSRFHHSELLRAEHLRIARDELDITDFHGAGCANLTLAEMHDIMGDRFWVQLTPHELSALTPAQIQERVRALAASGAHTVQLYPGRQTPRRNMEAAVAAVRLECPGGPR